MFLRRFALGLALASSLALSLVAGKSDGRLDIWWCDSDGGGSTLIVTPAGESILIDSGNPGGRDSARILKVLTQTAGLQQLDHLVITPPRYRSKTSGTTASPTPTQTATATPPGPSPASPTAP